MIKFFHELTEPEFKKDIAGKLTHQEVAEKYPQPKWCSYPEATYGVAGCWSLVGFIVTGEDYCKSCEFYKPVNERTNPKKSEPNKK